MISSPSVKSVSDKEFPQIELAVWRVGRAPSTTTQLKIASVPQRIRPCSKEMQTGCSWTRNGAQKRAILLHGQDQTTSNSLSVLCVLWRDRSIQRTRLNFSHANVNKMNTLPRVTFVYYKTMPPISPKMWGTTPRQPARSPTPKSKCSICKLDKHRSPLIPSFQAVWFTFTSKLP